MLQARDAAAEHKGRQERGREKAGEIGICAGGEVQERHSGALGERNTLEGARCWLGACGARSGRAAVRGW